jgi:CheY-like chemotaxis protein/predicted Ser/Thr protein kinase
VTSKIEACPDCGQPMAPSHRCTPVSGPEIVDGRYLIERELGRGGMGVVHRARDLGLGRPVAVKLISSRLAAQPHFIESFQREARALASIRSDHVVRVYAYGPHERSYFFAMELVEGVNLGEIIDEHLTRGEYIPLRRALSVLRQVANGLDAVHTAGIVHRDVKPDNVIVENGTGRPVIVDFGLAVPDMQNEGAGSIGGTPSYMAPEQIREGVATARCDVYALACMTFELLTGRLPFEAEGTHAMMLAHTSKQPPSPSAFRREVAAADPVIARALAKRPEDRPASAGAFITELEDAMALPWGGAVVTPRSSNPPDEVMDVLVVDDDPIFAKFAARAIGIAFYGVEARITVARDGDEAVAFARKKTPRLVLLDYDMPRMNGVDALTEMRAVPGASRMQVIVISATAGATERWRFGVLGVQDFIAKPVAYADLLQAVEAVAIRAGFKRAAAPPRSRK